MPRKIRVLDQFTVNRIAAGEVVESPSSVVKELVENSIDAGARHIEVHIDGGGTKRIQVTDDGCGMSGEDAEVAFTRHSTSKISRLDDLEQLATLGFRGEALASISSVSNVEVATREKGAPEESGTRVMVSGGRVLNIDSVGCPEGTRITVTDLFENVPARKRFLRTPAAERARCIDIFQRLMLVHPEIGFRLMVDGVERSSGRPSGDPRERAAEILGPKIARSLVEMGEGRGGSVTVSGLVSLPWETRSNSAGITIALGGRVIRNRPLVEAVRRGYGSRLMKGRFPIAVLFLEISPDHVDVNVHPTKDIVKFSNEGEVQNAVENAVSSTLFTGRLKERAGAGREKSGKGPESGLRSPYLEEASTKARLDRSPRQVPLMTDEIRPQELPPSPLEGVMSIEGVEKLPPTLPDEPGKRRIRIVGQLDRSYIICEIDSDLLLVDQHAAHERIRLEMLKRRAGSGPGHSQELLEPIQVELDPSSLENLHMMKEELSDMGFAVEDFGNGMISIRALPSFMGRTEGHEVLRDLVSGNEVHEGCSYPDPSFRVELPLKERMIALTACKGAIKAHKALSLKEMEDLLHDLLECEVPLHCAHGRPTMVRIPLSMLERWFRRVL